MAGENNGPSSYMMEDNQYAICQNLTVCETEKHRSNETLTNEPKFGNSWFQQIRKGELRYNKFLTRKPRKTICHTNLDYLKTIENSSIEESVKIINDYCY